MRPSHALLDPRDGKTTRLCMSMEAIIKSTFARSTHIPPCVREAIGTSEKVHKHSAQCLESLPLCRMGDSTQQPHAGSNHLERRVPTPRVPSIAAKNRTPAQEHSPSSIPSHRNSRTVRSTPAGSISTSHFTAPRKASLPPPPISAPEPPTSSLTSRPCSPFAAPEA